MEDLREKIGAEIVKAVRALGGSVELQSIIGSYGDTLDDAEVLQLLEDYNAGKLAIERLIASTDEPPTTVQ